MEQSQSIGQLAKALAAAQGQFKPIKREAVNPFFKSKYADLAAIIDGTREALTKNGLAFLQTVSVNDHVTVETMLMHESGEWVKGAIALKPKADDPQAAGSAITYGRRYSLGAILGVASEDDDDGNSASKSKTEAGPETKPIAPSTTEHWCSVHGTAFFKKGKMKEYAHPIAGTGDAQGKGVQWCNEDKGPRVDDPDSPEPPTPLFNEPPSTPEMSIRDQHQLIRERLDTLGVDHDQYERALKVSTLAGIKGEAITGLNRLTWEQAETVLAKLDEEIKARK